MSHEREREVFEAALERDAFLEEACRDDAALLSRVRHLVDAHARTGRAFGAPDAGRFLPCSIGPYRILHSLGEGGMGTVYLAE